MAAGFPVIRHCQPPLDEPCKEGCGASEVIEGWSARNRALACCSEVQSGQEVGSFAALLAIRDLTGSRIVVVSHDEQSGETGVLQRGNHALSEKIMPDDVRAALERFQQFLGQYQGDDVIDEASGFKVSDGTLLAGEIETLAGHQELDENPID